MVVVAKSAKAADITFRCPTCDTRTMQGLGFNRPCPCGDGTLCWNVHKARTVYTPRGMALINLPLCVPKTPSMQVKQQVDTRG
jgi:hypothetical protein